PPAPAPTTAVETVPKPVEAKPAEIKPVEPAKTVEPPKTRELRVAIFSGAYRKAQERAILKPFESKSGLPLVILSSEMPREKLLEALKAEKPAWDVADVPLPIAEAACQKGLLVAIDPQKLAAASDGKSAKDDFIEGALTRCGVASVAWSSVVVFERPGARKPEPKKLEDVFDVAKFPGNRALPPGPHYVLEVALLADGVAPAEVYKQLGTEEGLARAFKKLDQIKDHIVWWDKQQGAFELLRAKRATFALAFNGRAFQESALSPRTLGVIYDGQVLRLNAWVVPKASQRIKEAQELVAFATEPARLAAQASEFPYGPTRRSAISLVGLHPALKTDMKPHLPTAPEYLAGALRFDTEFWAANEARLKERFLAWRSGG
ncbi:MAG: extracellular solute-binding protein, partial [Hyphomicrobiaceae bacterium]